MISSDTVAVTKPLELRGIIETIETAINNSSDGLPDDLFLFISRITPLINVDLLIKNELQQTLLTWRDDDYYPPGWHVPGGIIRFKETAATRIETVAKQELGTEVRFNAVPLAVNEVIHNTRKNRGHFISLLYQCTLISPPAAQLHCQNNPPKPGEWMWHKDCPVNLISVHEMYRRYI